MKMTQTIIVATHKKANVPTHEPYLAVAAGAAIHDPLPYQGDDVGENISKKNALYCELTALYWGYKNLDSEVLGLVHYRRHFKGKGAYLSGSKKKILTSEEIESKLSKADFIVPKKRHYVIETLYSHYAHTTFVEPLDIVGNVLKEKYPEFHPEFLKLKKRRSAHMFNMMIAKKETLEPYLDWLFDVLREVEKKAPTNYDAFHSRFYGRLSELMLDIYLRTKKCRVAEVKVVETEKIKWMRKILSFLKAKFLHQKYDKSF